MFPCEHTEYETTLHEDIFTEKYGFSVAYSEDTEHFQNSIISVNEQTLIGQVGGILGILFGWSGMTLVDMITQTPWEISANLFSFV